MAASPYGFWTSPITSDLVVADSIRLEQVALDGDAIYWTETQPQKQGRTFVYRIGADGEPERVTPDDANAFSVRTRAHEYGGGSFAVSEGVIYFSNNIDQRLYRQDAGRPPSPITPAPAGAAADAFRYADGVIDRRRGRMVCVREDHTGAGEAITTLVAVDLSGATATQVLVSGNDFYSTPRLSPDGNRMSWLTWRHPDMPWVATEAWVGDILPDGTIGNPRRVAGGPDESVFQPEWSPDGDLYFVSDRGSGWWNLYRDARRRDRANGGDGRRIRATAMAVRHVDLRVRVRRSPDLMLRPRRRLDPGWDRYAVQALRRHSDRIY